MPDTYQGAQRASDSAGGFNAQQFMMRQLMAKLWTATLVKVVKVYPAAVGALDGAQGLVDIQPLVQQVDGQGKNPTPHGTIYGVPYFRLQGGTSAIVIDPAADDLGIAIFASRDISKVVTTQAEAVPGSFRQFDPADALYLGGFLNGMPVRYIQFTSSGMIVLDPTQISFQAPTVHVQGNLTVSGTVVAQGDVTGQGTSLHTHHHSGVTTGSGNTGPPT
ncbi:MAG TPA: hypothetical protein VG248_03380 [Caulobacteraceae bacterium]|nr:hypothetical protein [Caulobacteraceae bacterium]